MQLITQEHFAPEVGKRAGQRSSLLFTCWGRGALVFYKTSIFYIWLLQALTNPLWCSIFGYCRHWPTPSDVLYFAVPGTDQPSSDVLWRGHQWLGLIHGAERHPFPENDGVQGPHYTVYHPSTVLRSLRYVWWVGSFSILWTANILYSNNTWLFSPIKSTDTIPGILAITARTTGRHGLLQ